MPWSQKIPLCIQGAQGLSRVTWLAVHAINTVTQLICTGVVSAGSSAEPFLRMNDFITKP